MNFHTFRAYPAQCVYEIRYFYLGEDGQCIFQIHCDPVFCDLSLGQPTTFYHTGVIKGPFPFYFTLFVVSSIGLHATLIEKQSTRKPEKYEKKDQFF